MYNQIESTRPHNPPSLRSQPCLEINFKVVVVNVCRKILSCALGMWSTLSTISLKSSVSYDDNILLIKRHLIKNTEQMNVFVIKKDCWEEDGTRACGVT